MTAPRRRLLRSIPPPEADAVLDRQVLRLRSKLDKERLALTRLLRRLKRVFHSFERCQVRVTRFERELARSESQVRGRPQR